MSQSQNDRIVYTFTLHKTKDTELVKFLETNKITKNVKKGLKMVIEESKKQEQIENLDKEQLISIISLLASNSNLNLNDVLKSSTNNQTTPENEETDQDDEIDEETLNEYNTILEQTGGIIPGLNLKLK